MRFIFLRGFYLLLLLLTTGAWAQTVEKRVLFVVETSKETKALALAERQLVGALVETGLGGLLGTNDTFGVWTFSDTLHYGKFPMQRWSADNSKKLANQVEVFLKAQPYDKLPKIDALKEPLGKLVSSSPALMVVLVTSGKHSVSGTPFDKEIADTLRTTYRSYQKQKTPAVIMLSATSGKILRYSVSPAIGDVRIPLLTLPTNTVAKPNPPAPKPVKKPEPAIAAPAAPPAAPKVAPKALVITREGAQSVSPEEADKIIVTSPPVAPPPPAPVVVPPPVENLPSGPAIISSEEKVERIAVKPVKFGDPEVIEVPPAPVTAEAPNSDAPGVEKTITEPTPAPAPEQVAAPPVKSQPAPQREPKAAASASVEGPAKTTEPAVAATIPQQKESAPTTTTVAPKAISSGAKAETTPTAPIASAPTLTKEPSATPAVSSVPVTSTAGVTETAAPVGAPPPIVAQTVPVVRSSFPFLWVAGGLLAVAVILAFFLGRLWSRKPQQSLVSDWAERDRSQK